MSNLGICNLCGIPTEDDLHWYRMGYGAARVCYRCAARRERRKVELGRCPECDRMLHPAAVHAGVIYCHACSYAITVDYRICDGCQSYNACIPVNDGIHWICNPCWDAWQNCGVER